MTAGKPFRKRDMGYYTGGLYDPQKGTFGGRDSRSWAKILIYYCVFYGLLAVLGSICMWVFYQTLDPRIPKCQMNSSLIGTNPGLGFRPMPTEDNIESTLIWFRSSNKTSYLKWVHNLNVFLDKYYTPGSLTKGTATVKKCKFTDHPMEHEVCSVDVTDWKGCSRDNFFEYHRNSPCIFLKLNRIYGWVPEYYNDPKDLPYDMPLQLKYHIASLTPLERNTIWVSCEGENPADVEYLGPIKYYPNIQGFPGYYYPYKNGEGYLSPLIAVQFTRPTSGIVVNIECRAWAKNIRHNRFERTGLVHFELLID